MRKNTFAARTPLSQTVKKAAVICYTTIPQSYD